MSASKPQILFVDDEPNMLEMFGRMIAQETVDWRGHYCTSADEAMAAVAAFNAHIGAMRAVNDQFPESSRAGERREVQ